MNGAGQAEAVILVSTRTVDRLPNGGSNGYRDLPGGPAHYIGQALNRLSCPHRLITGMLARVDVISAGGEEEYVIPALPPIPLPPRLSASAVILSPIMREIDPDTVPPTDGLLVIDLQGFVRDPAQPSGHSTHLFHLATLLRRADIVKASSAELERLTPDSRAALSGAILLVTAGKQGARVLHRGQEHTIRANPVAVTHTIGAGDTFLAGFVTATLEGLAPPEAALRAARFTESVLRERE